MDPATGSSAMGREAAPRLGRQAPGSPRSGAEGLGILPASPGRSSGEAGAGSGEGRQRRGPEQEAGEPKSRAEEEPDQLCSPASEVLARPEEVLATVPSQPKRPRGRKPRKKGPGRPRGPHPKEPKALGESPGPSVNGPSLPIKVPKKRGRKSKAELLLMKLAQGLDAQPPEPLPPEKGLAAEEDCLETTPGRRPKRRAAKVALLYLQELAEELTTMCQAPPSNETSKDTEEPIKKRRGRKPREQKTETEEDEDFVPSEEVLLEEEEEEEEDDDEDDSDLLLSEVSEAELESGLNRRAARSKTHCRGFASNGLHNSVMAPVWKSLSVTHGLREQFHSPWEFAEWVPSARKWTCLSESEAEQYLPSETKSPFFSIRREGLQEDSSVIYRINRFNALQPHKERLDMTFFVGGPVWAMEWCPIPEGSLASQYVAIYCNPGMDDQHSLSETHVGPALLQLWELGPLRQDAGSATKPGLAFAIATDHGCIWDMKFCPSGAWEPPSVCRKAPQMSRLGLLAVAFSDGQVLIYSLPHVEALQAHQRSQVTGGGGLSPQNAIYKVQCVASLQVSSVQAGSPAECGQCFSLAWMPSRPHHHLAAGFYDGTVALWNLSSASLLQRVRQADGSHRLYPFHCFLAHDHAVRSIQWCKANSNFLVTAGSDRKIKFWDLRRMHEPLNSFKRSLSTEVAWLLPYSGVTVAQDNCYAPYGLCGIHYLDAGYLGFRAYFVAPRKGTVWSISGSDWLNTVAAGDVMGELVAAMMPDLSINPHNVKRPSERRFSIYKADLLPRNLISKEGTESSAVSPAARAGETSAVEGRNYSESVAHNYILFQDTDLRSFKNFFRRKARKHNRLVPERKEGDFLGRLQLEAIHKVRFSPNLSCHSWLASGGQSGLVRLHCLRALVSPLSHKLQLECQAQFSAMLEADGQGSSGSGTMASLLAPTAVS